MTALQGKVALVTGGSRGIGAAIAKRLAADGADVAITYVSSPDKAKAVVAEIEKLGRRGLAIQADSANSSAVTAAVEKTAAELKAPGYPRQQRRHLRRRLDRRNFASGFRPPVGSQRPRPDRRHPGRRQTHAEGWPHHHDRQLPRRTRRRPRRYAVLHDESRRRRPHPRPRPRAWSERHLRHRRRARPDRHRHEPRRRRRRRQQRAATALGHYGQPEDIAAMVATSPARAVQYRRDTRSMAATRLRMVSMCQGNALARRNLGRCPSHPARKHTGDTA